MAYKSDDQGRKAYEKPVVESTAIQLGVYGCYDSDDTKTGRGPHHDDRNRGGHNGHGWWR